MFIHLLVDCFFLLLQCVPSIFSIPLFIFYVIRRNLGHFLIMVRVDVVVVVEELVMGYLFLVEEFLLLLFKGLLIKKEDFLLLYFLHTRTLEKRILVLDLSLKEVFPLLLYHRDISLLNFSAFLLIFSRCGLSS
jgi:hypothetical protein